jgi:hypothetical protein
MILTCKKGSVAILLEYAALSYKQLSYALLHYM